MTSGANRGDKWGERRRGVGRDIKASTPGQKGARALTVVNVSGFTA